MSALLYIGWTVSVIGALLLVLGGTMDIMKNAVMVRTMEHIGFSPDVLPVFDHQGCDRSSDSHSTDLFDRRDSDDWMDGRSYIGTRQSE